MHSVEMLEKLIDRALRLGYQIRQDWLGGTAGGGCELRGTPWVFLDLSLSPEERLEQLARALANDSRFEGADLAPEIRNFLAHHRAPATSSPQGELRAGDAGR
jgi:hypothetical protein